MIIVGEQPRVALVGVFADHLKRDAAKLPKGAHGDVGLIPDDADRA